MSLLLDALKKAAEKKAIKSAEQSEAVDPAEIVDSEKTVALEQQDDTALTSTVVLDQEVTDLGRDTQYTETTELEKTEINDGFSDTALTDTVKFDHEQTQLDQDTQFAEATQIDATSIDETGINEEPFDAALTDPVPLDHDTLFAEATEIDATVLDKTEIDATVLDKTEIDPTTLDKTEVDATVLDKTEVDATTLDKTEVDATILDKTEIDATILDKTEIDATTLDKTEIDPTTLDKTEIDPTTLDKTEIDPTTLDKTEVDAKSLDSTEVASELDPEYQSSLTEENETLFIYDSDDESDNEVDQLTNDDVTQFMGDGVSKHDVDTDNQQIPAELKSDDTTLTNPESLTLTKFSFADDHTDMESETDKKIPLNDLTESDTISQHDYDSLPGQEHTSSESDSLSYVPDDERSTRINTDSTSTNSAVDIEKLTNDETVTVGGTASSKTYAPDNYDRTLLNLSEKDVSRIFPGMRPDSDTVMTPDYAKRIFLNKSGQVKTKYLKVYVALALILLLSVLMFGLFQLQEESDLMDLRLSSLKRDPMPGIIKPPSEKVVKKLFVPESGGVNLKIADIISKADEIAENESSHLTESIEQMDERETANIIDEQTELAYISDDNIEDSDQLDSEAQKTTEEKTGITPKVIEAKSKSSQEVKPEKTSTLMISSSSQVSQKHQLLVEAYEAYEQGNLKSALTLYNDVLTIDELDRDGLLGRAAIHVQQNEYQQAIDKYQQLLVANPKDSMAMASLISVANIDPQAGESRLKSMLREKPDAPYLQFALGNMYGGQSRWNEAQKAYFEALKNKPEDPNYAYNLAVSLEHIGQTGAAMTFYNKALENNSEGLVTFDNQLVKQRLEVLSQ